MKLLPRYRGAEDERRIGRAQLAVWFAGLGPALALAFVFMEIALGHPQQRSSIAMHPMPVVLGCAWLILCGVAGYLIGERRAAGGVLGLALFGGALVYNAAQGRFVTLGVAYSFLAIALILRAGRALRLPLLSRAG